MFVGVCVWDLPEHIEKLGPDKETHTATKVHACMDRINSRWMDG